MREIKFQYIWERDGSVATGIYDIGDIEKGLAKAPRSRDGSRMTDWTCVIRRQYIGIKDKNGVEIYEGDIVKYKKTPGYQLETKQWLVEFDDCEFKWSVDYYWRDKVEVVGNIYQNPELLDDA